MWSAMEVRARRTVANVKSSAMRPRQPEVPNLMGEAAMGRYCTRAGIVLKDERGWEKRVALRFPSSLRNSAPSASLRYLSVFLLNTEVTEKSHDSDWWTISDGVGYVSFDCRGAEDWPERGGEEAGGLREYFGGGGVDLPVEGESGAGAGSLGSDEDYGGATAGIGERSEARTRL